MTKVNGQDQVGRRGGGAMCGKSRPCRSPHLVLLPSSVHALVGPAFCLHLGLLLGLAPPCSLVGLRVEQCVVWRRVTQAVVLRGRHIVGLGEHAKHITILQRERWVANLPETTDLASSLLLTLLRSRLEVRRKHDPSIFRIVVFGDNHIVLWDVILICGGRHELAQSDLLRVSLLVRDHQPTRRPRGRGGDGIRVHHRWRQRVVLLIACGS
mmetsp:Transcript_56100/g.154605  ORF Transcript_56100/g.154605 Transcript_56100/m.154605 type:complete len:211 (-) Transcript_56100:325-957(-)